MIYPFSPHFALLSILALVAHQIDLLIIRTFARNPVTLLSPFAWIAIRIQLCSNKLI